MKKIKKGLLVLAVIMLAVNILPGLSFAALMDTSSNEYITVKKTPNGKTGKTMSISGVFTNTTDRDLKDVKIGLSESVNLEEDDDTLRDGWRFPFEVEEKTFSYKNIGSVKKGDTKNFTISARVRRDLAEGYYTVPLKMEGDNFAAADEYVNIWISKSSGSADDDKDTESGTSFVMGEGQDTPYGVYPNVLNFTVNVKNNGSTTAQDVTVSMVLSKDSAEFPFEINEANYDRAFEKLESGETVSPAYSMAIREDAYSGYYPIKFNIFYKESSGGEELKSEEVFFVRIKNKEKDKEGEFDINTSKKARIIIDGFETNPAEITAGEPFELIVRMKNASADIPASNILFSMDSEKVSDSAVFSIESGSSSIVVNQLGAGQSTELRYLLNSKAGVEQRSYGITIKEKYDSPEFMNAEESVTFDIPIKQIARLNMGTIEIMPNSISVGAESNVMFGINNTGKVQLYNVMVVFKADSINSAEAYVGNIKPGETGNVDVMITGAMPTADEGKIPIIISYEDENGNKTEVEKEMTLYVTEDMGMEGGDFTVGNMENIPMEETGGTGNNMKYMISGAVALAVVGAAVVFVIIKKKKKKKASLEEGMDDEIS